VYRDAQLDRIIDPIVEDSAAAARACAQGVSARVTRVSVWLCGPRPHMITNVLLVILNLPI
jgi:hypothetical protein